MNYAILRIQKLKSAVSVHRSMKHAFREQETPNADESRTPDNTHIGANSVAEGMANFRDVLPDKVRKNGVLAVEYLITASPEAMHSKSREAQDKYFSDSLEWLKAKHGAENVVYAGIHRDETTPHMYAYVVPIDRETGRLNAAGFFGARNALSEMQTDFADSVAKDHGLERGIEGSKAKHQTIKQFYGAMKTAEKQVIDVDDIKPRKVSKDGLMGKLGTKRDETPDEVAERLKNKVAPIALKASQMASVERNLKSARLSIEKDKTLLKPITEPLKGIPESTKRKIFGSFARQAEDFRTKLNQAAAEKQASRSKTRTSRSKDDPGLER